MNLQFISITFEARLEVPTLCEFDLNRNLSVVLCLCYIMIMPFRYENKAAVQVAICRRKVFFRISVESQNLCRSP